MKLTFSKTTTLKHHLAAVHNKLKHLNIYINGECPVQVIQQNS